MSDRTITRQLREIGLQAARDAGYTVTRATGVGRGPNQRFVLKRGSETITAALRTTRDNWIAFPPLEDGTWGTLSDVDAVLVSALVGGEAHIWLLPAEELISKFDAGKAFCESDGRVVSIGTGFWRYLFEPSARMKAHLKAGANLTGGHEPLAVIQMALDEDADEESGEPRVDAGRCVLHAIQTARADLAADLGLPIEAVQISIVAA